MRQVLSSIVMLSLFLCVSCQTHNEQTTNRKKEISDYFQKVKVGTLISEIERDLKLPKPTETNAPSFGENGWGFKYVLLQGDLYLTFHAKKNNAEKYVYLDEFDVFTHQEYYDERKANGLPVK